MSKGIGKNRLLTGRAQFVQRQLSSCRSEAGFIGEESACCLRRYSRFLAQKTALRNDNLFGIFNCMRSKWFRREVAELRSVGQPRAAVPT